MSWCNRRHDVYAPRNARLSALSGESVMKLHTSRRSSVGRLSSRLLGCGRMSSEVDTCVCVALVPTANCASVEDKASIVDAAGADMVDG
jgi:hypothetical protein